MKYLSFIAFLFLFASCAQTAQEEEATPFDYTKLLNKKTVNDTVQTYLKDMGGNFKVITEWGITDMEYIDRPLVLRFDTTEDRNLKSIMFSYRFLEENQPFEIAELEMPYGLELGGDLASVHAAVGNPSYYSDASGKGKLVIYYPELKLSVKFHNPGRTIPSNKILQISIHDIDGDRLVEGGFAVPWN